MLLSITLHCVPIFRHFGLRFGQLVPSDGGPAGRQFHHFNTMLHRTDVVAKSAADAVILTDARLGTRVDGFVLAVRVYVISVRLNLAAVRRNQVNALMRSV